MKDRKGGWGEVSSDEWMIVVNDIFSNEQMKFLTLLNLDKRIIRD